MNSATGNNNPNTKYVQNKTLQDVLSPLPDAKAPECLVFSDAQNSRLQHTCEFIFHTVFLIAYRVTSSIEEYKTHPGLKINYSGHPLKEGIQISPHGLLGEKGLSEIKPDFLFDQGFLKAFVNTTNHSPTGMNYDVFAMVFYFISRYEEWQKYEPDEHGRFGVQQSILFKYKTLQRPIVDLCLQELKEKLTGLFPDTPWPATGAKLISTIDVDNLYAFKGRPLWKTLAAGLRDGLKGDFKNLRNRWKVLTGKQKDPFDIYDEVPAFCEKTGIPLIFFFLYRNGTKYDRGLKPGTAGFTEVFRRLKRYTLALGLHPSYYSSSEQGRIHRECLLLENHLGQNVVYSRQHFLRFNIRTTPQQLIQAGICADFSMGFSDTAGFRAGTSFPFRYYDFENEKSGDLHFVPFCIMDGAYSIHHKMGQEAIIKEMAAIAKDIKQGRGYFISVFHERSFYDHLYPGFGTLYRELHLQIKALLNS